jgi:hypothetical protein
MTQRRQMLTDAIVQLARQPSALIFLHPPDRTRELAKMLLTLMQIGEQAFLLCAQPHQLRP